MVSRNVFVNTGFGVGVPTTASAYIKGRRKRKVSGGVLVQTAAFCVPFAIDATMGTIDAIAGLNVAIDCRRMSSNLFISSFS